MRSLWWVLTQYDCCPYFKKKKNLDTETDMHRGKKTWRHTGRRQSRDWTDASLSPRMQAAIKSQKGRAGPLPPWVLESMAQPTPWFPTASLQNCDNTSLLSFWYFVGVSGVREVGFIARHAWVRRGQPKALCLEEHGWASIWPPATGEEPLFGHHVSKFIHIKLWRSPLLGTFWRPGTLNLALRRASITCFLFCSLVQMDIVTWPTWTLATVPWGFPEAPHIPVWSLSAPGQDRTPCWWGWCGRVELHLDVKATFATPFHHFLYLLAQIWAASTVLEESCSYSSDPMWPQRGNSSSFAFFRTMSKMHLSIRDTLAEVRLWVRLALTIPVTLGRAVAHDDTKIFSGVPKGELQIFDVDHF